MSLLAAFSCTGGAATPAQKCSAAKLKATGLMAQRKLLCYSTAANKGRPVDQACLDKANSFYVSANQTLQAAPYSCLTTDDAEIENVVNQFVYDVVGTFGGFGKIVFITSTEHIGNLAGLLGADTICANLATAAGLVGTYKAWLFDGTTSAANRLTNRHGPTSW